MHLREIQVLPRKTIIGPYSLKKYYTKKSGFPLNMIFDVCHSSLCVFDIMRADAVQSLYDTKPEKSAFDIFF